MDEPSELVAWLTAQLAAEYEDAIGWSEPSWVYHRDGRRGVVQTIEGNVVAHAADRAEAEHIARYDPARAFLSVESTRLMLTLHTHCGAECWPLRVLASQYGQLPGYRPEWKP